MICWPVVYNSIFLALLIFLKGLIWIFLGRRESLKVINFFTLIILLKYDSEFLVWLISLVKLRDTRLLSYCLVYLFTFLSFIQTFVRVLILRDSEVFLYKCSTFFKIKAINRVVYFFLLQNGSGPISLLKMWSVKMRSILIYFKLQLKLLMKRFRFSPR